MIDISKKTLEVIKKEEIKPKARWHFLLRNYVLWTIGVFSLFVGSISVGIIIFLIKDQDWSVYRMSSQIFLGQIFLVLPYFWVVIILIFGLIAYYNVRHTREGYRYSAYMVVLISVGFSLFFGSILYAVGLGEKIDETFYVNLPPYRSVIMHKIDMWQKPEAGRLIGVISGFKSNNEFVLESVEGIFWTVKIPDDFFKERIELKKGSIIGLIGRKESGDYFVAKDIRPWLGRPLMKKRIIQQKLNR